MLRSPQSRPHVRHVAVGTALLLATGLLVAGPANAATQLTMPIFGVTQEGLTVSEGAALGDAFGLPNALEDTGAFDYVDSVQFNAVPLIDLETGLDEAQQPTVSQAIDMAALDQIVPLPDQEAVSRGQVLLALSGLSPEMTALPEVSHSEITITDDFDEVVRVQPLDTTVSYQLNLAGLPMTGQGARLRITFAADGSVIQLSHALRRVDRQGDVPIIDPVEATAACAALYDPDVSQGTPTLGYQFPELTSVNADGTGTIATIFPQYTCNPVATTGTLAHRLVPAVAGTAPTGNLMVTRVGDQIDAFLTNVSGTGPYTFNWSSSSTVLSNQLNEPTVSFLRDPRDPTTVEEQVTVEVTDANGLAATASVTLSGDGTISTATAPGGGGFGELAVGPVDVGIEQTVNEWQCAQDSANGFKRVMTAKGIPVPFDWRGFNAWEWDFKEPAFGGGDSFYVDNVDAAWYTGHGWPGGFTFKSNVTDRSIVPSDARWGNRDLEWLQLESCQVLRDTNGTHDYFRRWRQVFQGLHILNGFHTNAYCIAGGTGGAFAGYLFPAIVRGWLRPAMRVQAAWALMAITREPRGVVYRSMGLLRPSDFVSNIGDYFWGQGRVGPDLAGPRMWMWSITGRV